MDDCSESEPRVLSELSHLTSDREAITLLTGSVRRLHSLGRSQSAELASLKETVSQLRLQLKTSEDEKALLAFNNHRLRGRIESAKSAKLGQKSGFFGQVSSLFGAKVPPELERELAELRGHLEEKIQDNEELACENAGFLAKIEELSAAAALDSERIARLREENSRLGLRLRASEASENKARLEAESFLVLLKELKTKEASLRLKLETAEKVLRFIGGFDFGAGQNEPGNFGDFDQLENEDLQVEGWNLREFIAKIRLGFERRKEASGLMIGKCRCEGKEDVGEDRGEDEGVKGLKIVLEGVAKERDERGEEIERLEGSLAAKEAELSTEKKERERVMEELRQREDVIEGYQQQVQALSLQLLELMASKPRQ